MKFLMLLSALAGFSQMVISQDIEETSRRVSVTLFGAVSLPQGDFGSTESTNQNAGLATTGYAGAFEISSRVNPSVSWTSTVTVAVNPLNIDEINRQSGTGLTVSGGSYTGIWGLTGVKLIAVSPAAQISFQAQGGFLYSSFPDIEMMFMGTNIKQTTTSEIAFGFGLGAGIQVKEFNIGFRYNYAKPEYTQKASGGSITSTNTVKLPMSVLLLMLGITI